jgi:hypothetical protein
MARVAKKLQRELNKLSFAFIFHVAVAKLRPELLQFQKGAKTFWTTLYAYIWYIFLISWNENGDEYSLVSYRFECF